MYVCIAHDVFVVICHGCFSVALVVAFMNCRWLQVLPALRDKTDIPLMKELLHRWYTCSCITVIFSYRVFVPWHR